MRIGDRRRERAAKYAYVFGVSEAAEEFDVSGNTIRRWIAQLREEGYLPADYKALYAESKKKVARLESENKELREVILQVFKNTELENSHQAAKGIGILLREQ